ncbi:hypothetical protein ACWD7C_18805 [Streptomyces sp. NPDC005134]|uniref:hypothetical protein n=1 Tax=unclassified Streptomyces TaxID=2593676 RepID=UPI0033BE76C7
MGSTRGYTIESLDTGLRLMQLFLAHDTLTVSEAAAMLSIGAGLLVRYQGTGPAMNEFALGAAVVCVLILAVHPWVGRRPERAV